MFRPVIDLVLLATAAALLIGGIAAYPDVPAWILGSALAVAAVLIAPVGAGQRTAAPVGVK